MSDRISQLNLDYNAVEDRMLMSIATTGRREYRIWLTRRFLSSLWPVLIKVLEADPAVREQAEPVARQAVLSLRHEQAVTSTDFKAPYQGADTVRPHGDEPLLVSTARVRPLGGGGALLGFESPDGTQCEFTTSPRLMHSLCSLLSRVATQADWKLTLDVGEEPVATSSQTLN